MVPSVWVRREDYVRDEVMPERSAKQGSNWTHKLGETQVANANVID